MKTIRSRHNPVFKRLARLASSSRECRLEKLTIVEGERLLWALQGAGRSTALLVVTESAMVDGRFLPLLETISADQRIILSDELFAIVSSVVSSQGVMALVGVPDGEPWPEVATTILLLEGIQDPGNLGSILRTAAAAGIHHVGLSAGSAFAWAPKVVRAGMGAHFHLSIHEDEDLVARAAISTGGVVATSPHARQSIYEATLTGPVTWVFGNEGAGLSARLMQSASLQLRVPMPGLAESLNVAATVAVCLFEQLRQRSSAGPGAAWK